HAPTVVTRAEGSPAAATIAATIDVVVVLPLVPVTPTVRRRACAAARRVETLALTTRNVDVDDGAGVVGSGRIAPVQRAAFAFAVVVLVAAGIEAGCERDRRERARERT